MTYNVFGGTLNLAVSIYLLPLLLSQPRALAVSLCWLYTRQQEFPTLPHSSPPVH